MSDSDLHVNPDRLRDIAEELSKFSNDVKNELSFLNGQLAKLGRSWQDEEYKKFKNAIQPLHRILEQFHEEIIRSKPAMLADVEQIRAYQKLQAP